MFSFTSIIAAAIWFLDRSDSSSIDFVNSSMSILKDSTASDPFVSALYNGPAIDAVMPAIAPAKGRPKTIPKSAAC